MYKDKRYSKRKKARDISLNLKPLDPQTWFRFWNGTECCIRDISMVGAGVCCKEKIPVGTPLSIDMSIGKRAASIRVFGKVIWIKEESGQYKSGVSFSWWKDDQDKIFVGNFLEKLSAIK